MRVSCLCGLLLLVCSTAFGQVFDVSPTAATGEVDVGSGQALYGGFGLDAANGASYNVYRKYVNPADGVPLQEAENVAGNVSAMNWTGLHHQGNTGVIDPGMFIGTSPSQQSYEDQLLYFRPVFDEEGTGNGDSDLRHDWDVRFGFLEDVNAFVSGRDGNDSSWDLWSGEWFTDGVSAQLNIGTNDTLDETDWYTRYGSGGMRLNAADDVFDDERGRDVVEMTRTYIGSGDEVEDGNQYAGAGYEDALEISWDLKLNDPDNEDPVLGREVRFSVKIGSILQSGVFDPGAADDPVAPNLAFEEPYSDGFFDWQNATPVFFVAPQGGSQNANGIMGMIIPGDVNTDGTVDADDRAIIEANQNMVDTSYARGDINQDGLTNADDLAAWDGLGDIASQIDAIKDLTERTNFVHDVAMTWLGDSNLDGEFSSGDLVEVFTLGEYEDGVDGNSTWVSGDWNGDGDFDTSDFVAAFSDGGYENGPRAATAAVPEPAACLLLFSALACVVGIMRRRR